MQDTNVTLMEDGWTPDAYIDAYRLAQARSAAIDAPFKHAEPPEYASPAPVGSVQFAQPIEPIPHLQQPPFLEELAPLPAEELEDGEPLDLDQQPQVAPEVDSAALDWLKTPVEAAPDERLWQPFDADRSTDTAANIDATPPGRRDPQPVQEPSVHTETAEDAYWEVEPLSATPEPPKTQHAPPASKPRYAAEDQVSPIGYWRPVK